MLTTRLLRGSGGLVHGLGVRRPPIAASLISKRYMVGDSGDDHTGHINTSSSEGILFFNSILPPNLNSLVRFTSRIGRSKSPTRLVDVSQEDSLGVINPARIFKDATQDAKLQSAEVVEVLPRFGEGGAFLKFKHDGSLDRKSIAQAVAKRLNEHPARPWWNPFTSVKANLVLGKPWVEDLSRHPCKQVKVEFLPTEPGAEVAELTQEQLYSFFRPFGKLSEIVAQPSDSKVVPRYAYLDFSHYRKAIMAKNCMHGYIVSDAEGGGKMGTILRVTYERKQRWFNWIFEWLSSHPRIAIPILAALVASITVAIFDPIRTLSIKAHITRAFHLEDNFVFQWFQQRGSDLINKVRSLGRHSDVNDGGMKVVWEDRQKEIEQIQSWLMESADTFIVVQGPRGSGKKELVLEHALQHKREAHRVLVVDCKNVQEARGDAATIAATASQVGYWPVFSWMNNISGLMDLAAQGMTGTKAGFSETLENQMVKIWSKTSAALKSIALEARKKDDKDSKLSDDEFLESHPEHRPVVVIDNFLHKNGEAGSALVYDKMAEWAAQLTTSNIAHVIFLTTDVSYTKSLSKALPDRVFRQISLGDCSPDVAKRYVINHLDFDAAPSQVSGEEREEKQDGDEIKHLTPSQKREDLRELDEVIGKLGGRLTDLEFFARRIKAGETPSRAVQEIIDQSASEILKMYLLLNSGDDRSWTSAQAWTIVRNLASNESLRYNELLLEAPFASAGGDKAIQALEQAELISVQSSNGRPYSVKPGKPVYQPAFQQLVADNVLQAKMELALLTEAISGENKSIDKYEQELRLLGELPNQPGELFPRMKWLLKKIEGGQRRVVELEEKSGVLKKVLQTEF